MKLQVQAEVGGCYGSSSWSSSSTPFLKKDQKFVEGLKSRKTTSKKCVIFFSNPFEGVLSGYQGGISWLDIRWMGGKFKK